MLSLLNYLIPHLYSTLLVALKIQIEHAEAALEILGTRFYDKLYDEDCYWYQRRAKTVMRWTAAYSVKQTFRRYHGSTLGVHA